VRWDASWLSPSSSHRRSGTWALRLDWQNRERICWVGRFGAGDAGVRVKAMGMGKGMEIEIGVREVVLEGSCGEVGGTHGGRGRRLRCTSLLHHLHMKKLRTLSSGGRACRAPACCCHRLGERTSCLREYLFGAATCLQFLVAESTLKSHWNRRSVGFL
jgi:hypothetical protein